MKSKSKLVMIAILSVTYLASCGSDKGKSDTSNSEKPAVAVEAVDNGKGIGPVKSVSLAAIDLDMVAKGKAVFEAKCTACHKITDERYVGPGQKGVTERRSAEWIMNMIMNPQEMTQKDPQAKKLLAEFMTPMPFQDVTEEEARAILEYFRQNDGNL